MQFIDDQFSELNINECIISTTVQALNVMHLNKIYEYLSGFKNIVRAPNLVNLHFPWYLTTTVLPSPLKKIATINLMEIKRKYHEQLPSHYNYLLDNINNVIHFMNSKDSYSNGDFDTFKKFQENFDSKKN